MKAAHGHKLPLGDEAECGQWRPPEGGRNLSVKPQPDFESGIRAEPSELRQAPPCP
jgi:hypothetical protein